jgi:hypothetical protein
MGSGEAKVLNPVKQGATSFSFIEPIMAFRVRKLTKKSLQGHQPAAGVIPTNAPEPPFFWRPERPILSLVLPSALTAVIPSGES